MGCGSSKDEKEKQEVTSSTHACPCGAFTLQTKGTAVIPGFNCECDACQLFYGKCYEGQKDVLKEDIGAKLVAYRQHCFAELYGFFDVAQLTTTGDTDISEDEPGMQSCHGDMRLLRHRCKKCQFPVLAEHRFKTASLMIVPWRTLKGVLEPLYLPPDSNQRGDGKIFGSDHVAGKIATAVVSESVKNLFKGSVDRFTAIQEECRLLK